MKGGPDSRKTHGEAPVLQVERLVVQYRIRRDEVLQAVAGVDFRIEKGETLGLVGESGCGKSSLARAVMQLPPPDSGMVLLHGEDLTRISKQRLRKLRPTFQIVFQDAVSALNPCRKIGETMAMPLRVAEGGNRSEERDRVREMMVEVGLDASLRDRRPFQLSGGQCQRVQIARALMTRPHLLVCDEPVSSLDVSVQARILNLLEKLRRRYRLTMLFISHDLAVVKNVCDRVAVMYLGKICEIAPSEALYRSPAHPYTEILLGSIPKMEPIGQAPKAARRRKESPSPLHPPAGCRFRTRCPKAAGECATEEPVLETIPDGRRVACHRR